MVKDITQKVHARIRDGFSAGVGWKGSLDEFLVMMKEDPGKYMRTSVQFVSDMVHFFGFDEINDCGEKIKHYRLFEDKLGVGEGVYGQDRMLMQLVSNMETIARGGGSERIFLLKGPVATAKTSIVRILIKGAEEYSKTPEGGVYTFNWVFPITKGRKKVGFNSKEHKDDTCYAHLKRSEALANIPCQMNDSPLLLYPRMQRKQILEEIINKSGKKVKIPAKILKSELCFNCQTIYNRLLEEYSGDLDKVFQHIQVERLGFSETCNLGCATIQPVKNTDGDSPVITMETESYHNVGDLLKGIELHKFSGKWVDANRGIIHYSDIFKRNGAYLQYLLSAVQEFIIDFNGVQGFVDVMILGTTNLEDYERMLKDSTNKGLMDRTRVVEVGYILQPSQEAKIYRRQFDECGYTEENEGSGKHIMPHVVDMMAMWNVMTRLKKPMPKNYAKLFDDTARAVITSMSPLVKAKLYDGIIHKRLSPEEKLMLVDSKVQRTIRNERTDEGMEGISPRTMQNVVADIISRKEAEEKKEGWVSSCLSFHRIKHALTDLISQKPRELASIEGEDKGYGRFENMIEMVEAEYQHIVASEIKRAFIGITPEKRKELIDRYLDNVEIFITKQGRTLPDIEFMEFIEKKSGMRPGEEARLFIGKKVGEIAKAVNEKGGSMIVGMEFVYDNLFSRLEDGLFDEKRQKLLLPNDKLYLAVKSFGTRQFDDLSYEVKDTIASMFWELVSRYGYCNSCAKNIVCEALEEEYLGFKVKA
ncbi:MAG: hypothetical protein PHO02_04755 [Candidatus Nanoarchaeia archaeon]|nr:hypothetical protein [Candidatus Nanoarchaeia archaeon]